MKRSENSIRQTPTPTPFIFAFGQICIPKTSQRTCFADRVSERASRAYTTESKSKESKTRMWEEKCLLLGLRCWSTDIKTDLNHLSNCHIRMNMIACMNDWYGSSTHTWRSSQFQETSFWLFALFGWCYRCWYFVDAKLHLTIWTMFEKLNSVMVQVKCTEAMPLMIESAEVG